jgi:isopentenyl diphosphate isomerase/L-lactate dehydrogenase-like FMN-dependent dehydrogenase
VGTEVAGGIGVVDRLRRKLEAAMAMLGAPTLADLRPTCCGGASRSRRLRG